MATATTTTVVDRILHPPTHEKYDFAFNKFLRKEYRFGLDPNRPACKAFMQGHCPLGNECPDKHIAPPSHYNLVCKHWLRGLCKKGDACEFLHEYNLRRMPECNFYSRDQTCSSGEDCLYQHIDPESKVPPCPHYERGFCPLGPHCGNKHVRRDRICPFYLVGFCPDGASCKDVHPRFPTELKKPEPKVIKTPEQLEQERLEKEEQRRKEEQLERERDEKAGITPMDRQQPWNRGRGGGHWQKKKRNHSGRPRKY